MYKVDMISSIWRLKGRREGSSVLSDKIRKRTTFQLPWALPEETTRRTKLFSNYVLFLNISNKSARLVSKVCRPAETSKSQSEFKENVEGIASNITHNM